jgi:hypothetical protein
MAKQEDAFVETSVNRVVESPHKGFDFFFRRDVDAVSIKAVTIRKIHYDSIQYFSTRGYSLRKAGNFRLFPA